MSKMLRFSPINNSMLDSLMSLINRIILEIKLGSMEKLMRWLKKIVKIKIQIHKVKT